MVLTRSAASLTWALVDSRRFVAKSLNEVRFRDFLVLAFNDRQVLKSRKDKKHGRSINLLLFAVQLLMVALFVYLGLARWGVYEGLSPIILYVRVLLFFGLFVGVKYFIEKMMGVLFEIEEPMERYHDKKLAYRNYIGLILLPVNALLIYAFEPAKIVFWIMGCIILILNLGSLFNIFKRNENIIYDNPFYFILYLCALEIAPYLILFKIIVPQTGT